jgi:hypothetical protein
MCRSRCGWTATRHERARFNAAPCLAPIVLPCPRQEPVPTAVKCVVRPGGTPQIIGSARSRVLAHPRPPNRRYDRAATATGRPFRRKAGWPNFDPKSNTSVSERRRSGGFRSETNGASQTLCFELHSARIRPASHSIPEVPGAEEQAAARPPWPPWRRGAATLDSTRDGWRRRAFGFGRASVRRRRQSRNARRAGRWPARSATRRRRSRSWR